MAFALIASLLHRAIGLNVASIGSTALASAVRGRMSVRGFTCAHAYAAELEASPHELNALVEAVVIPETWFFRDRLAFVAVEELAKRRAETSVGAGKLRLASLPCSTGEEPYSLAMTLLAAGLKPTDFEIHAFDVSAAAIERALAGVYGRNSFRGTDLAFRSRHFSETPGGWRLSREVAGCVRFSQANLLEMATAATREAYDVVFCRNLLIYFDPATQQRAVQVLRGLLKPDGTIFVGPGEANVFLGAGFASVQRPLTFGFRLEAREPAPTPRPAIQRPPVPPRRKPPQRLESRTPARSAPGREESRPDARPSLAEVHRLADLGRIDEAIRACEAHVRRGEPSAEAWRLLGVLCEAGADPARAVDCYRKALYLDPMDAEALDHLGLLLQRQGDATGARRVLERARRLNAEAF